MKKIKVRRIDKIRTLIDMGVLDYKRYVPRINSFECDIFLKKAFPRFAVTKSQKQMNSFRNIKWSNETIYLEID